MAAEFSSFDHEEGLIWLRLLEQHDNAQENLSEDDLHG